MSHGDAAAMGARAGVAGDLEEARRRVAALERSRAAPTSDGPLVTEVEAALRSLERARRRDARDLDARVPADARWISAFATLAARILVIVGAFEAVMTQNERQRVAALVALDAEDEDHAARLASFLACHKCLVALSRQAHARREMRIGIVQDAPSSADAAAAQTAFSRAVGQLAPALGRGEVLQELAAAAQDAGMVDSFITALGNLPDFISGPLATAAPTARAFRPRDYFRHVAKALLLTPQSATAQSSAANDGASLRARLIAKFVAIGQASAVVGTILQGPDVRGDLLVSLDPDTVDTLTLSSREVLWKALLIAGGGRLARGSHKEDAKAAARFVALVFPPSLVRTKGHAQDFAFRKLFLARPRDMPRNVLWGLVRHLQEISQAARATTAAPAGAGKLYLECTRHLASIWGDRAFVMNTDAETLSWVSGSLFNLLTLLQEKDISRSGILSRAVAGVQHYLEASDPQIRVLGMIVATQISRGSGQNLRFQEVDELGGFAFAPPGNSLFSVEADTFGGNLGDEDAMSEIADQASESVDSDDAIDQVQEVTEALMKHAIVDEPPDAPQTQKSYSIWDDSSDEDDDDDAEEDGHGAQGGEPDSDDEDAGAGASGKDGDTSAVEVDPSQMPAFLHDAVKALQEDKDYLRFQTCLVGLEALIQRRPADLGTGAAELAQVLVHAENRFNVRGFAELRMKALVTLVEHAPSQTAGVLISEATQERATFIALRTSALEALVQGAQALRNAPIAEEATPQKGAADGSLPVQQPVGRVTKRWGQRRQPAPAEHRSRFAGLAGSVFFFPLLNGGLGAVHTAGMREPIVLAKFLFALGSLLAAAKHAPDASRMGRALFRLLWSLRGHEDAQVRRAALYALAQIFLVVPVAVLSHDEDWLAYIADARDWIGVVASRDPDLACREQAGLLLRMLSPARGATS